MSTTIMASPYGRNTNTVPISWSLFSKLDEAGMRGFEKEVVLIFDTKGVGGWL